MGRCYSMSFVVTAIMLSMVSQAFAECAWVLWIKEESVMVSQDMVRLKNSLRWNIHSATQTKKECDAVQHGLYEKVISHDMIEGAGIEKADVVLDVGVFRSFKGGGYWNTTLHCLPDNLDPRNRKDE